MDFPKTLREDEGSKLEREFFLFVRDAAVGKKKETFTPMKVTEEGEIQKATIAELKQLAEKQLPVYQRLWKSFHLLDEMRTVEEV